MTNIPPVSEPDLAIRPRRDFMRRWVLRVAPSRYYERGGFELHGETLVVGAYLEGSRTSIPAAKVTAVVCTFTAIQSGDWRVLLLDDHDQVLARRWGMFFNDDDLGTLADALHCPYRREDFSSLRKLRKRYPGATFLG